MKKDPAVFLGHILESMYLVEGYLKGVTEERFLKDSALQDAVIRLIEIMGEAVKNIPEDEKALHAHIPWRKIAGMRDKIIHEYFGIDLKLVWNVTQKDLPPLKKEIQKLLP